MDPFAIKAFNLGILSALSLPLGAVVALLWVPKQRVVAALMAFGGGALLAALTIDLVGSALRKGQFYPLALGCILGGLLFVVLNQLVNSRGGFLRKAATTINHLKRKKVNNIQRLCDRLSRIPLFHHLPPEEIQSLIHHITRRTFPKGSTVIHQGDPADSLYIIESGQVDVFDEKAGFKKIAAVGSDDILGEMALLTGEPRRYTCVAAADTRAWVVLREHFDRLLESAPSVAAAVKRLVSSRISDLQEKKRIDQAQARAWAAMALKHFDVKAVMPSRIEIREAATSHRAAPLAIWLGILLDGIPESLVIGSSLLNASISYSLIAGLFLSNFPEALSSSAEMRQQHYSSWKIFWMWTSLMIITGVGALLGFTFFRGAPPFLFALVNGLAAGAMLTMISETMLPEAFYKGGGITGFSTLLGFLAAIFFKTLE